VGRNQTRTFSLTNSSSYLYYKLNITANNGEGTTQLSEMSFAYDILAPSIPAGLLSSDVLSKSITLSWNTSVDNVGVSLYEVFVNGSSVGTTSKTTMSISDLSAGTNYELTVSAIDGVGNRSGQSKVLNVVTLSPDNEAPTAPKNISFYGASENLFFLTWNKSTDNIGVAGYQIFKNGTLISTTAKTMFPVTGLDPSTTYTMTIKALDNYGNSSEASTPLIVSTLGADSNQMTLGSGFNGIGWYCAKPRNPRR
jgi:chitodextrinase